MEKELNNEQNVSRETIEEVKNKIKLQKIIFEPQFKIGFFENLNETLLLKLGFSYSRRFQLLMKIINEEGQKYFEQKKLLISEHDASDKNLTPAFLKEWNDLMQESFEFIFEPVIISEQYLIEKNIEISAVAIEILEKNNIVKIM